MAGRVAVVTGASSGIGAATAEHLAELGARVALLARRAERLDELAARIDAAGGTALPLAVDVTDEAAVRAVAKRVAAELGDADLVLNNAGVMLPSPVEAVATDVWRRQLDLNAGGVLNVVGGFVPQLLRAASERGRVADLVNVSSVAAFGVFAKFAVYSGTKAFVSHLSRNLRAELGPRGVRVTALEPGIVGTELQEHVTDGDALEWLASTRAQHEWLVPEDIATTVGFLASLPPRVNLQQLTVLPTGQV
ncbi:MULTISPECIES: SDR family oxidoreductase [Streptomyces]|uniref:SDR family oxidoreductase n=1 Tax=Streptomyces TaxID=1883 RepID=UPI001D0389B3|nr:MULTISPECIES: SDR family oxidoreductase [Streptomyces]